MTGRLIRKLSRMNSQVNDEVQAALAPIDPRKQAKLMYWANTAVVKIAEILNEKAATIHSWKRRDKWDDTSPQDRVELTTEARYVMLVTKAEKTGADYKEIDLLGRQMERFARVRKYDKSGNERDLNPKVENRNKGERKKVTRNEFTDEHTDKIRSALLDSIFPYQRVWYEAGLKYRIRDLLKSRQVGATWFFAREALDDAMQTGRNQIFLSASKAQAHVFKEYIRAFAMEAAGLELTGDPMVLPTGATLYFLGTNTRTAQSYHGNIYMDEYFWIHKFSEFRKVASGMAMHKNWRQTYLSTPSTLQHEAYGFWSGQNYNKGRSKEDKVIIDLKDPRLSKGMLCADGQWRQIVTVEDAAKGGCDLFDIDQLRLDYSEEEFANLLMCQFMDDTLSVFSMQKLQSCMVDSWEVWEDFKPFATRPFGEREVWIGYDPTDTGDAAGLAVVAPPMVAGGKFRVIERLKFHGSDFADQAEKIRQCTLRYNVTKITIDSTGLGAAVYQLVKGFFPSAVGLNYSVEVKTMLVLKTLDVIKNRRLEFDAGHTDIPQAFMAIKKTTTPSGGRTTYKAGRSSEVSHADVAWAIMNALYNEPLEGVTDTNKSMMEIY